MLSDNCCLWTIDSYLVSVVCGLLLGCYLVSVVCGLLLGCYLTYLVLVVWYLLSVDY